MCVCVRTHGCTTQLGVVVARREMEVEGGVEEFGGEGIQKCT